MILKQFTFLEVFVTQTMQHLQTLLDFGPRPIGSPANQAAADYIHLVFDTAGLDVEEQPYACTAWEHHSTLLEQEETQLDCIANPFSLPCGVTAPIVAAGSIPELEAVSASGQILFLYGDLTRTPLAAKSWFLKDERSEQIIALLERLQPAALLSPPTSTDYFGFFTEDWELDIPAATVSAEVALQLLKGPEKKVHLKIDALRCPTTTCNIVARTPGMPEKRLVICAHFDTKINTPGATDNGAGVAALLSLVESMPRALPFGLEFIAFNGEEYLPIGDDEYVRRGETYFSEILACLNMDGAGAMLGSNNITAIACPTELEEKIKFVARQFPGVVWVDPWPESNHSTFAFRGVPAIAISASGTRGLAHSVDDTFEQISPAKLDEVVALVNELVKIF
jgi:aminopeptidase YwaD